MNFNKYRQIVILIVIFVCLAMGVVCAFTVSLAQEFTVESEAINTKVEEGPTPTPSWDPSEIKLKLISDHERYVPNGTIITYTASVKGIPEWLKYEIIWQSSKDGEHFTDIGATGKTYSYELNAETSDVWYRFLLREA